jgi:hypothetical protein
MTDHHDFSADDYVLEGASIRDRFLTAYVLRYGGVLEYACPSVAEPVLSVSSYPEALLPDLDEESAGPEEKCVLQPLTLHLIGEWDAPDGDDEM